ncbi:unnamed protein product, partial [Brassica rapa subsp. trilocularis]
LPQVWNYPTAATVSNNHHHHQGGSLTAGFMISYELESGGGSSSAGVGAGGFDFPGGMSYISILGRNNNQMPGLELGFAQEGNVGVFNQRSFTQIYQQMTQAQVQAQGRVLHHTLHHNPSHEDHHQQESDEKDDSQGSRI